MMRWVLASSLKFRLLVIPVVAALMYLGFAQLPAAPVDALPEFSPPTVQIQTEALGLSAAEVEQLVTVPLEQDLLNGVAWLQEIRSTSVAGLSSIDMIFEPGTDVMRARQMVQERMTQAHALPNVSKPPVMIQPVSSTSRVMMVSLSSAEVSMIDMSVLARWRIKPRLMGVPGVANVSVFGQRERQLQIQVDPQRLADSGVTLNQVIETSGNALWVSPLTFVEASTPGTGGFLDTPNQRLTIQHVLPIRTPQDLAQVRIDDTGERALKLGDVAQVVEDHQPLIGDAVVDDGAGLMLVVEKLPGANTLEVTKGIEDALAALRPGLSGIRIDSTIYRPATFIENAVDNLRTLLLFGLVLLALIVGAFLFDWRTGLIVLVTIPTAVVAAALVLYWRGGTFNMLILAGLAVGLAAVIDDAIGDTDHIRRRLREHREAGGTEPAATIIAKASFERRTTLLYATLILLVAAVPAVFQTGLVGAFTRPLALAYVLAVLAALAVALLVTPALAMMLFTRPGSARADSPLVRGLRRGYMSVMSPVLRWALPAAAATLVLLVAGVVMVTQLGGVGMLPSPEDRDVLVSFEGPPGTSRQEMLRVTQQASSQVRAISGVRQVGAHVGRAIESDQAVAINSGEMWVSLHASADYRPTINRIRDVFGSYPGFTSDVHTYPQHQVDKARSGLSDDIVVRVYGQDLKVLQTKAEEVRGLISTVDGVVAPQVRTQPEEATVEIEVNLAAAEKHGLKPGDVRRATAVLISGLQVGNLFEDQKVFDVVVWGTPASRQNIDSVGNLLIDTPGGGHVRVKDVADVRVRPNPTAITHDAVSRRIDVTASVRGRSADAVAREIESKLAGLTFPIEYHAEVLGGYQERSAAAQRWWVLSLVAAIAILLLLQAAFGSWGRAALLLVILPVAAVGGVFAAWVGGYGVSLGALLGMFLVWGLAVRHGMLFIRRCQELEAGEDEAPAAGEDEASGPGLVLRAARERFGAVLVSTLAVAFVLLPFAVFGAGEGVEVLRPMAIVALGALVTSTLLTLFIVPVLYLRFGPRAAAAPAVNGAIAVVIDDDADTPAKRPADEPSAV